MRIRARSVGVYSKAQTCCSTVYQALQLLLAEYIQNTFVKQPNYVANWYEVSYKHILIVFLGA